MIWSLMWPVILLACLVGVSDSVRGAGMPESPGVSTERPVLSGIRFRQSLSQRVSVSWTNTSTDRLRQHSIRHITRRVQELWRVSILLDRRIDPSSEMEVRASNRPVREVLGLLVEPLGGGISVVGNTVYMGPTQDARVLRTLVHLRNEELKLSVEGRSGASRIARLGRKSTVRFDDLTSPREVLAEIARRWKLEIHSVERIPHDLWAGSQWPRATATEALSLVLIQYGLTFEWTARGQGIRIIGFDRPVSLVGRYRARGGKVSVAVSLVRRELPGVSFERAGSGEVGVRGTWEDLQVARALIERGRRPAGSLASPRYPPLSRRRFTLRVARARAADVMKQLEQTGVRFEYDSKSLKSAGVRFDQPVTLDVREVAAGVFFEKLFGPLGLSVEIDGLTVRLRVPEC
jgi:hypothetical protein